MNWLTETLQRIGVLPNFTANDILNAESEQALVDHRKVLNELIAATEVRRQVTTKLRVTLQDAALRNVTLAEFEQNIQTPLTLDGD